ncbi:MAG: hypothetical protein AAF065_05465 [Verrucomicrobiota bacterium]
MNLKREGRDACPQASERRLNVADGWGQPSLPSLALLFVPSVAHRAPASLTLRYAAGKSFRFTIFALLRFV